MRRAGDDALHVGVLAVEDPQGIAAQAPLAVLVESRFMSAEIGDELLAVGRARGRGPQRIDQKLGAAESEPPQQARREQYEFRVDIRAFEAECFGIDLMELPVAPGLRPLAPEHRTHAPDSQTPLAQHAVGNHGADDACGRLRAQGDMVLALIDETEHLLLDDVGEVADRTLEQLCLLDHRNAEFLVPIRRKHLAGDALQVLPGRDLRGQHIVHAAQGLDDLAQGCTPISC